MKSENKLNYTTSSSTTTTLFTRINFTVGNVTKKEKKSIIKDIKKFMIPSSIVSNYEIFSVFYNSTNDQKEISKLFFKLKLRFPKFEIHAEEITYSFRS